MAVYSDNFRSKSGRRRPFLLVGSIIAIPIFTLAYIPLVPDGIAATVWYGIFHIATKIIDTVFMVCHDAWGAEMTPTYEEKTKIYLARSLAFQIGILMGAVMPAVGR